MLLSAQGSCRKLTGDNDISVEIVQFHGKLGEYLAHMLDTSGGTVYMHLE